MSGYLRNMTRRALRVISPVHSVARLPYARLQTMFPPVVTEGMREESSPASEGEQGERQSLRGPPARTNEVPEAENTISRPDIARTTESTEHYSDRAAASTPGKQSLIQPDNGPYSRSYAFRQSEKAPRREDRLLPLVQPGQGDTAARDAPFRDAVVDTRPKRILPLVTSPTRPDPAITAFSPVFAPIGAAANSVETTEIHVSIGRIELSAVYAEAPPQRSRAKAVKTMSLSEYEDKRRTTR